MGLFDDIKIKVPLPDYPDGFEAEFQTKSLNTSLDNYEIREDGSLWHEDYDIEDQSDPTATGLSRFKGVMTPVNKRWVPVNFTGEVRFYDYMPDAKQMLEYSAYFVSGQLRELHRIHDR